MCQDCLDTLIGDTVLAEPTSLQIAAAGLIAWVYEQDWGGAGGPLHCEIEDHNLEDQWFEADAIERQAWHSDLTNLDWDTCNRLYLLLKGMTEAERAQTMMLADEVRKIRSGFDEDQNGVYSFNVGEVLLDPTKTLELTIEPPHGG